LFGVYSHIVLGLRRKMMMSQKLFIIANLIYMSHTFTFPKYFLHTFSISKLMFSKKVDIRPSLDDIERISYGQAAKRRGVGSRAVPHRLNAEERREWVIAKKRRYLALKGSGWRKERGDSPIANIYRNYCDAVGVPCIRF
jgi:hypothetical protein